MVFLHGTSSTCYSLRPLTISLIDYAKDIVFIPKYKQIRNYHLCISLSCHENVTLVTDNITPTSRPATYQDGIGVLGTSLKVPLAREFTCD